MYSVDPKEALEGCTPLAKLCGSGGSVIRGLQAQAGVEADVAPVAAAPRQDGWSSLLTQSPSMNRGLG